MSNLYKDLDNIELMRKIVIAIDAGEEIEVLINDKWLPKTSGKFDFEHHTYRVKPKTLECYANEYSYGVTYHESKELAEKRAERSAALRVAVKLVEVPDE